jgi:hypothetical protein
VFSDPVALLLVPVFLAIGVGLGYYLVRTMSFWVDGSTGALWMRGGATFAVILIASIVVRFGVRAVVFGSLFGPTTPDAAPAAGTNALLYDLSADLLFVSLGLWASRAFLLTQRFRQHQAATSAAR